MYSEHVNSPIEVGTVFENYECRRLKHCLGAERLYVGACSNV
jgi:hypothetical protein